MLFYLALGLERLSLERPRVSRKCHIWLAPELSSVFLGFLFFFYPEDVCLAFSSTVFFLFNSFLNYFVLECVARHRAALLGSASI